MKITIKESVVKERVIDVRFPYYYKQDIGSDYGTCVIYGYLTEKEDISICETTDFRDGRTTYEIEKQKRDDSYFEEKYKSDYNSFEKAKKNALEFINSL